MPERFLLLVIPVILSLLSSTIEQTLTSAFLFGFMAIYLFNKSRTYKYLTCSAVAVTAMHFIFYPIPAYSLVWPIASSFCYFFAGLLIFEYGDKHKKFQISAIVLLVILDFLLAYDYVNETSLVFDWYFPAAVTIIIMQIVWGTGGVIADMAIHSTGNGRSKRDIHAIHYRKGTH